MKLEYLFDCEIEDGRHVRAMRAISSETGIAEENVRPYYKAILERHRYYAKVKELLPATVSRRVKEILVVKNTLKIEEDIQMIAYKIAHHIPGRIRIEIPALKSLSFMELRNVAEKLQAIPVPAGVREVRPNPLNMSLVIIYEPEDIDIIRYINEMISRMGILSDSCPLS
jgi:hypothetical protein